MARGERGVVCVAREGGGRVSVRGWRLGGVVVHRTPWCGDALAGGWAVSDVASGRLLATRTARAAFLPLSVAVWLAEELERKGCRCPSGALTRAEVECWRRLVREAVRMAGLSLW